MEFFNKKEEVLDVELTEYGKYLLAIGQLNPTYYAFFDDDIQYDVSGSGYTENQNTTANRIQYNTPKLKILANRTGAETRVNQFLSQVGGSIATISSNSDASALTDVRSQQPFESKGKLTINPLGNSSISTPYSAAWQLNVVSDSEIASSSRNYQMDPSGTVEKIPQININIDYQTFFGSGELSEKSISGHLNTSNVFLALNENYLMIELIENNTDFEKENFDIEVFQVQTGSAASDPDVHIQKSFLPDGGPEQFLFPTTENVEYYMNVWVDSEVPTEIIDALSISSRSLNTNLPRLKLNRDLYTTDNEEPCE